MARNVRFLDVRYAPRYVTRWLFRARNTRIWRRQAHRVPYADRHAWCFIDRAQAAGAWSTVSPTPPRTCPSAWPASWSGATCRMPPPRHAGHPPTQI